MAIDSFGGGKSVSTTEDLNVDIKGDRLPENDNRDEEEKRNQLVLDILERKSKMRQGRPDTEWQTFTDQYESNWHARSDGLSNVKYPIAAVTIRNKIADELSSMPLVTFRPVGADDVDKIDITHVTWNHVWQEAKTSKELIKAFYGRNIYGTSVWFEGVETKSRIILDPSENGFVKKKLVTSRLVGRYVDLRRFYIDPVDDVEKAEDCIEEEYISMSELESLKFDPMYDAEAIDRVIAMVSNPEDKDPSITSDEKERQGAHRPLIKLDHYWNKIKDKYVVVANELEAIREQPIPYSHKELPYSVLVDELILGTVYGRGICKLTMNSTAELQSVRNIMIDGMKMAATTNLLIGEDVSIPVKESTFGGEIWSVDGDISQIQELNIRDKTGSTFNVSNMILDDITIITGIDNRALLGNVQRTAFEARLKEQNKIKGIGVNMRNADIWLERWGNQRLKNIQQFFAKTFVDKLIGENEVVNQKSRSVLLEDKKAEISVPETGKRKISIKKQKGFQLLELTGDDLRSSLQVSIKTRTTTPILEAIRSEQIQSVLEQINQLVDIKVKATQSGDPTLAKLDTGAVLEQIIIDSSLSPENILARESKDIKSIVAGLNKDVPLPPKPEPIPGGSLLSPNAQ